MHARRRHRTAKTILRDYINAIDHLMLWDMDKGTILADFRKPGITILGGTFVGDRY